MSFTISLNPTYLCNFRCNFCYLTDKQLGDKKTISYENIVSKFEEVLSYGFNISNVDLYGGEVALLSYEYLKKIHEYITNRHNSSINVITNLSTINKYFLTDGVKLSVSFDFDARESYEKVLNNIIKIDKEVSILMLASPSLISKDVLEMVNIFNSINNVVSVEIKPYSTNQANSLESTYLDYESFVLKWIKVEKNFEFVNEKNIIRSLSGKYNAYSDNHVYITPNNKFAVLDFDDKDNEYFNELDNFGEYITWSRIEKSRVNGSYCGKCKFLGKCLTEHYRNVDDISKSCNGFYNLLDHYFKD